MKYLAVNTDLIRKTNVLFRCGTLLRQKRISNKIGFGVSIFLFSIGFLTLVIARWSCKCYVCCLKERTREIGIKMANRCRRSYIMAQFIFESLLLALSGGTIGILFCYAIVWIMWMFPAEEGAMQFVGRPVLSFSLIFITVGILSAIGFMAGVFPARKAAGIGYRLSHFAMNKYRVMYFAIVLG